MSIFNFLKKKKPEHIVTCRCGFKFRFDWSKFHDDVKTTYTECPHCHMELKIGNPKYFHGEETKND
ncbi:MAG: hypothetical protein IKJ30_07090 [Bacilli bacterium]|nr:hypothetical protein [Bacilli bacterium]